MDTLKTIINFSGKTGVSGIEGEAAAYGKELLSQYGNVSTTPLGSLICTLRKPLEKEPHIMLMAHMDEIGMIVTNISQHGFISVSNVGGVDRNTVLAACVTVHGSRDINGIVCSVPPHLQSGNNKALPKIEEIFIDTGYTKEELSNIVTLGDRVTFNSKADTLLNGLVTGKAMDDRAGCVALLHACELICKDDLNCGVSIVFSTMEEVGSQGAISGTAAVNPTHAIAVDVSFAFTPDNKPHACGKLSEGPMIGFAPILNNSMSKALVSISREKNIPYQMEIMGGKTGTDADLIAVNGVGVKTALLSIPLKYMHTRIETVDIKDIENTGILMAEYIKNLGK